MSMFLELKMKMFYSDWAGNKEKIMLVLHESRTFLMEVQRP